MKGINLVPSSTAMSQVAVCCLALVVAVCLGDFLWFWFLTEATSIDQQLSCLTSGLKVDAGEFSEEQRNISVEEMLENLKNPIVSVLYFPSIGGISLPTETNRYN